MLLAIYVLAAEPQMPLATCTRFYNPAGDRRVSHYHAWLMSLDGKRWIQLSRRPVDAGPVWADRNHLAWSEQRGKRSEFWIAEYPSLKRRLYTTVANTETESGAFDASVQRFRLGGKKAKTKKAFSAPNEAKFDESGKYLLWRKQRFSIANPNATWNISLTAGLEKFTIRDLQFPISSKSNTVRGTPIVRIEYTQTAHDSLTLLMKLDRVGHTATIVPIDAMQVDLDVPRLRFLGRSNHRTAALVDIEVWVSDLYVGDLPSLRYRKLDLPLSSTNMANLRPGVASQGR